MLENFLTSSVVEDKNIHVAKLIKNSNFCLHVYIAFQLKINVEAQDKTFRSKEIRMQIKRWSADPLHHFNIRDSLADFYESYLITTCINKVRKVSPQKSSFA